LGSASKKSLLTGDKRRSRIEIIAAIVAVAKNWEQKTEIAKKTHLNSRHLQFYLDEMTRLGLLQMEEVHGEVGYMASVEGIQILKQYKKLRSHPKA
jgi:predicted transcriptional regulator